MKNPSVQFLRFKQLYPVATARLRRDFKHNYGSIINWMHFEEVDGDLIVDSPKLPEPIVLRAGSKHWAWQSSDINDEFSDDNVV